MKKTGNDLFATTSNNAATPKPKTDSSAEETLKLSDVGVGSLVARRIKDDIDRYCIDTYDGGHRWHLGASLIGESCKRKLWFIFRWCFHETAETVTNHARKQRLFNRGHREEARYIEWLEGIGCEIHYENRAGLMCHAESDSYWIRKDDSDEGDGLSCAVDINDKIHVGRAKLQGIEFPQYRVSAVGGHFGGSLDGIVKLPPHYGIDEWMLAEFKTNGTGATFNKLLTEGMPLAKPQHFAQTSTYGSDDAYKLRYAAYFNINKNDDDLHVEVVKLDWNLGQQMRDKAELIIRSQTPPPRLSESATFRDCQYCAAKDICHKGAVPERNCRSCIFASPVPGGEWYCQVNDGIIPRDFIPQACGEYKAVTQNV